MGEPVAGPIAGRPRGRPSRLLGRLAVSPSSRLVAAQAFGQLALVAVVPVLTRVYSPVEMGGFQLAAAIAVVIQPLSTLGREFTIPLAPSPASARRLRRQAWSVLSALILGALVLGGLLLPGLGAEGAAPETIMVGMLLFAYGGSLVDNAYLIRCGLHGLLAVRNVLNGVLAAIFQVVGGFAWGAATALALGVIAGRALSILLTARAAQAVPEAVESPAADDGSRHVAGGLSSAVAQLLSVGALQSLTILVSLLYGAASGGLVGLAVRTAAAPIGLFGQALAQIAQVRLAPSARGDGTDFHQLVRRQTLVLAAAAFVLAVVIAVGAPLTSTWIFGPSWAGIGTVIAVLAVPFSLQVVLTPLYAVFVMVGRAREVLVLQLVRMIVASTGVTSCFLLDAPLLASVLVYSTTETVVGVVTMHRALVGARSFEDTAVAARATG